MNDFIAVCYYTKNTSYEKEVQGLIQSLDKFNIPHDIVPVESLGSWQANTTFKATFLLQMLKKYAPRPIVWFDADSVLLRKPEFFSMIDADAAFYYRTTGGRTGRISECSELISATMYFKTNDSVERLLNMWISANKKNIRDLEQHVLQEVIPQWRKNGGIMTVLPQTYCKIFDSDPDNIVIMQNQASRRFRNEVDR